MKQFNRRLMKGDGNCQFRGWAYQCCGQEDKHLYYRSIMTAEMKRNPELYKDFQCEDQGDINQPGVWGGHVSLIALCNAMHYSVTLFNKKGKWIWGYYKGGDIKHIYLEYTGNHYNALIPKVKLEESVQEKKKEGEIFPKKTFKLAKESNREKLVLSNRFTALSIEECNNHDNLNSQHNEDYNPKITYGSCKPNLVKCKVKKKTDGTLCSPCKQRKFKPKKTLKLRSHRGKDHNISWHYCEKCSYKCTKGLQLLKHIQRKHTTFPKTKSPKESMKVKLRGGMRKSFSRHLIWWTRLKHTILKNDIRKHFKTKHEGKLCLCGGGGDLINRTNKEIRDWLKETNDKNDNISWLNWLKEATIFFGKYNGSKNTFQKWKTNFEHKEKQLRKSISDSIIKDMGGLFGGRFMDIPPPNFFPSDGFLFIEDKNNQCFLCTKCEEDFNNEDNMKEHIRIAHKAELKKMFRKEANSLVHQHSRYIEWLDEVVDCEVSSSKINNKYKANTPRIQLILEENKVLKEVNKILEANQAILKESLEDNQSTFKIVRERSAGPNIVDTERIILTENTNGQIKKNVIKEQMAKVTTRKRSSLDAENEDPNLTKKTGEGLRKQAKVIDSVLKHLAGNDLETMILVVAKLVDKYGDTFSKLLIANSKAIQNQLKFSPEETAALIAGTGTADNVWAKYRTASNKTFGWNTLSSHKKVKHARSELLPIIREDWNEIYPSLYKNKQGKNKRVQSETCVLVVKNLGEYISKMANSEKEAFSEFKDGDEIHVCYDADGGGGRFIAEFAFLNRKDQKIKLHPFLIYEGTDIRPNLEITLGHLTQQFKDLEDTNISVDGKQLKIVQFGVFDLCALNAIIGKQNHSSTFFDAWTDVTNHHIKNHAGKQHTPDECKNINFLTMRDYDKNITHHSVETGPQAGTGKLFGSIVADNLIPLKDIFRYIPPLMHIIMGLGNDLFKELKRVVIGLDIKETEVMNNFQSALKEQLEFKYQELDNMNALHSNSNVAKKVIINDLDRIQLMKQNKLAEAEKKANELYSKNHSRRKKNSCNATFCLIFPCDENNDWDEMFNCDNGCKIHMRCEGVVLKNEDEEMPNNYTCKQCVNGLSNSEWIENTLRKEEDKLTKHIHNLNTEITKTKMHIQKLEEEEAKSGPRQKELKNALKELKINPARYHGGDFEGKSIQAMLDCARGKKEFKILDCINDHEEIKQKFVRALTTLRKVSDLLRYEMEDYTDEEILVVKKICEKWGENWTIDFPHLNITPKGHDLVFVIPKALEKHRHYFMFYKMEEKGESIHAELNDIQRKIWCIRRPADRLWTYIERYELKNILDIAIVTPLTRVSNKNN